MPDDFNHAILEERAHRPWPIPQRPWVMTQTWTDLLFAHWAMDPDALRAHVPASLPLDLFDGRAWLGVVPFSMSNVGPRGVPAVPRLSAFPELNVRTYVRVGDRGGVFFFSLDAASRLAVRVARAWLNLPYYAATMRVERQGEWIQYQSQRRGRDAQLAADYAPAGDVLGAAAGSLEHFLTERYCLYHHDRRGRPYRLEIHHPPWRLRPARLRIHRNTLAESDGLPALDGEPLAHVADRQDVVAWAPEWLS